jgi:hypothetical protein
MINGLGLNPDSIQSNRYSSAAKKKQISPRSTYTVEDNRTITGRIRKNNAPSQAQAGPVRRERYRKIMNAVIKAKAKWMNLGAMSLLNASGIRYSRSRFMG